jgi:hypothetical protein
VERATTARVPDRHESEIETECFLTLDNVIEGLLRDETRKDRRRQDRTERHSGGGEGEAETLLICPEAAGGCRPAALTGGPERARGERREAGPGLPEGVHPRRGYAEEQSAAERRLPHLHPRSTRASGEPVRQEDRRHKQRRRNAGEREGEGEGGGETGAGAGRGTDANHHDGLGARALGHLLQRDAVPEEH